ncbi:probable G- coupled receptor 144, partial, partial [Pelobates cultripes]
VVCITVTASLHLFFMAAFAWMLVEGLLLWSKVVAVNMSEDRRMRFYYITGWGLPIVIVSVTLATSFNKYVADTHCWLNVQTDIIWAFVGPVLFILT